MKRSPYSLFTLVILAVTLYLTGVNAHAQEALAPHVSIARALLEEVTPETNEYRHKGFVRWKGDVGILGGVVEQTEVRADCSGLMDAVLERSQSKGYVALRAGRWKGYPKAENYYEEIHAGRGFERRATIQEAQVGDMFAAKYVNNPNDTGHVMMVDAPAVQIRKPVTPLVPDTVQWEVTVIDSSHAHYKGDTRWREGEKSLTGIGRGVVRIYTDAAGVPVGWAWSRASGSVFRDKDLLAIGKPLY